VPFKSQAQRRKFAQVRRSGDMRRVLIAGISTRAAAESAARAGYDVTAIDAFADRDQDPRVRAISVVRDMGVKFTAAAVARAARTLECDAVAYLSSFENHLPALRSLSAGRALWGNPPAVLKRVRDPRQLADALHQRGFAFPALSFGEPDDSNARWLVKPFRSGGGARVRPWLPGSRVPRGCYLEERIGGTDGSVSFVAARGKIVPLAVCRQMIGDTAFGGSGFRYCGSILERPDAALTERAIALARAVAQEFGLVGANGIDFVARDNQPVAIEVNPRWSASMELVERAHGVSMFGAHADACDHGVLPPDDVLVRPLASAIGKAVVFARRDVSAGDTREWLDDDSVRDVPHPGERILAGHPICTVFASGTGTAACHAALVRKANDIYQRLAEWQRDVA
jgi:predicted ATP-grasp superfamily ATP-dependent carboligase